MEKQGNKGLLSNLVWKFSERITAQLVSFVVSVILARLLDPAHYGVVSIVMVFITFANIFVSDGFGAALIQKKDADEKDFYSVLWFNLGVSALLYLILFFAAPAISRFYGDAYNELVPILRVLGIRLFFCAINSVQQAYVSKQMLFKKFFWSTLLGTVVSAVVGIALAYRGYGAWALVAQYLTNSITDTFVLNRTMRFKLKAIFSLERIRSLARYGFEILGARLLVASAIELRALLIGKVYSSDSLAFYDKGKQMPNLIITNLNASISAVLFPKMSTKQDDRGSLKEMTSRFIRLTTFILCPMMFGLAACSKTFVTVVLTEKWLPCVPLMQLFCFIYLLQPVHTANMQVIKAVGRGDTYLKLELVKKALELITLIAVYKISVQAIVISMLALELFFVFLNALPNKKLIGYTIPEMLKDIFPAIALSAVMGAAVLLLERTGLTGWALLILQVLTGCVVYLAGALLTRNKELGTLISMVLKKKSA